MIARPIYLDNAATTPVDPRVVAKMVDCLGPDGNFGNPASRSHRYGWLAEEVVETARTQVAELINCDPRELVWTSGATESNNLAIKGAASFYRPEGNHIVTSKIEHKSVLDSCRWLETQGYSVTFLSPDENGVISVDRLRAAIRNDTVLVSLMHVNNEIGSINDISSLGQLCRDNDVVFHVDAAQSAGKISIDLSELPVDLMSFSAHKLYGPKGAGALYVRRNPQVHLVPQIHGGGHERGMRSGTLATHQLVGMGEACAIAARELEADNSRIAELQALLWNGLSALPDVFLHGHTRTRIPHILNVAFGGVTSESLINALTDVAVSSGSACNSSTLEPSYVLTGIGIRRDLAEASLRFSIGRFTTKEEILHALARIKAVLIQLRAQL